MTDAFGGELPDPNDPAAMSAFFSQMQQMFNAAGPTQGPVNWPLARRVAQHVLTGDGSGSDVTLAETAEIEQAPTSAQREAVEEALRLADLWLEPVSTFPSGLSSTAAWTRGQWLDETEQTWHRLFDPVAAKVVEAMRTVLPAELEEGVPPELLDQITSSLGGLSAAFSQIGGAVFGTQVGQALGTLASEVLTSTDIGLPLGSTGAAALLPTNLAEFGEGLELPLDEVRLYVALREVAHHRLYGHVPWLRSHVLDAVTAYARGIHVDRDAFTEAVERMRDSIDPEDPSSAQMVLSDNIFRPAATPEQEAALSRLETALALIEGWVAHVVDSVAGERLPAAAALSETFRRRRAAGGPAEQTFASLVGLELRPRRSREAGTLWAELEKAKGVDGRDGLWAHPDLLPDAEDLSDPVGFAARENDGSLPGFDELE
ncbi:MAG: zinc-dependent metalloprotease [Corynebacteriales bacterium]|nr:zinc-dependent metalloprotease [Mycobacteriales bacterium]